MFAAGLVIMGLPVLLHLITLPVEFDASFRRALPIIIEGNYLPESAIPIVRQILTAAALTYLAASLFSLLNFYRWIAILRR
jgi:Zn-dependent membrane protease YugP